MAQTIKLKRSANATLTSGQGIPTTSDLALGEVAINTYHGTMYIKKNDGTDAIVQIGGASSGALPLTGGTLTGTLAMGANAITSTGTISSGAITATSLTTSAAVSVTTQYGATLWRDSTHSINLIDQAWSATLGDYLVFNAGGASPSVNVLHYLGQSYADFGGYVTAPLYKVGTTTVIDASRNITGVNITASGVIASQVDSAGAGFKIKRTNSSASGAKGYIGFMDSDNKFVASIDSRGTGVNNSGDMRFTTSTGEAESSVYNLTPVLTLGTDNNATFAGNITVGGTVDGRDVSVDGTKLDGIAASANNYTLPFTDNSTNWNTAVTVANAALPKAGGAMTGAITTNSTFDGRDVATDGTKLDTIETSATADQTQAEINALGITATGLSGTPNIGVGTISSGNITTTGYLRGPSTFTIDPAAHGDDTGTVVIAGNLQIDGTTTTINSTTLTVDDKLVTLASGSANAGAANGAGIEVDITGATNPSLTYDGTNDEWDFNKDINVTGTATMDGLTVEGSSAVIASFARDGSDGDAIQIFNGGVGTTKALGLGGVGNNGIITNQYGNIQLAPSGTTRATISSTGIDVTGTATMDGLTVQTAQGDISIPSNTSSLNFARAGFNYLRATDLSGSFSFITGASDFATQRLNIASNGDISFYEDTGTTPKLFWDSSASSLGIGTTSVSGFTLNVAGATQVQNNLVVVSTGGMNLTQGDIMIKSSTADSPEARGQGVFMFNEGADQTWYAGTGYNAGAQYHIGFAASTSASKEGARVTNGVFHLYNNTSGAVFNENGADRDFRVEAVNSTHALFVQGSDGNVGIGTTSPSEKLHIHGGGIYTTPVTYAGSQDHWALKIGASNNAAWDFAGIKLRVNSGGNPRMSLMGTGQQEAMAIVGSRVGIGSIAPTCQLEVTAATNVHAQRWSYGADDVNYALQLGLVDNGSSDVSWNWTHKTNAATHNVLTFKAGNVGIGTTAPDKKLEVAGDIKLANSGKLYLWADHDLNYLDYSTWRSSVSAGMSIMQTAASHLALGTSNTERMRIDASGALLLNPNNATRGLKITTTQVEAIGSDTTYDTIGAGYGKHIFKTDGTERLRIDSSGNVGIGTSPAQRLDVSDVSRYTFNVGNSYTLQTSLNAAGSAVADSYINAAQHIFQTSATERMRIDSSGNVIVNNGGSGNGIVKINGATGNTEAVIFQRGGTEASRIGHANSADLTFSTGSGVSERMRIDSSGNVGIGTSSPNQLLSINSTGSGERGISFDQSGTQRIKLLYTNSTGAFVINNTTAGYTSFENNGSERMRIDSSGNVGIGGGTISSKLFVNTDTVGDSYFKGGADNSRQLDFTTFATASPNAGHKINATSINGVITLATGSTERFRLNSDGSCRWTPDGTTHDMTLTTDGNLLVGKTSTSISSTGIEAKADGQLWATRDGNPVLSLNRKTSDGSMAVFYKDGTTVGSIGTASSQLYIGTGDTGLFLNSSSDTIQPINATAGTIRDGLIDLGSSGARFKDLYLSGTVTATGGNSTNWNTAYTTANAALPKAGGAMTGPITTNSTFDGRDVATDGAKLDGIESGATADQTQSDINALGITQVGTISSGTWNGSVISSAYLDSDTAHLSGTQTFTGGKTFSAGVTISGGSLNLSNLGIGSVNNLQFADPGPDEGLSWSGGNIKLYESPDDLTTNTAGNLQVVYGSTRRFTVNSTGVDVNGALTATTKSFDIEHPSKKGMRLHHGVVEGPEHSVYVRGKSKEKVILLPDYWVDLVHEDTITIQLTAIGSEQDLYVEDIKDNKVFVNGDNYFYYIQAERKDVERFEVEYEV